MTSDPRRLIDAALSAAADAAGIFWELDGARARRDVQTVLRRRREGSDPHILDGIPVAVKDAFAMNGLPQHLGLTRVLVSDRDAAAVVKLRDAGAIVIGTTAMDQLGWTMTGQAPGYPRCENPLLPGRSPGGSSGGAAAAVAAGIVPLALGVDSAGSVRVPAAWCGVVGFKPSFGAIDLDGCAPLAPCLDSAGIIAQHVDACRLAFTALSVPGPQPAVEPAAPRLGIPTALIGGVECDPTVLAAWRSTLDAPASAGFALREVDAPPNIRGIGALFATNLAARWGDVVDAEPRELVHPDVRAGVEHGRALTVRDYLGACDALAAARRSATSLFAEVDLLGLPAVPVLPPPLGNPAPVSVASAFTRPWNAFGCPAVTVPCAHADRNGCAVQFIARPGDDIRLLGWASRVQQVIGGRGGAASAELRNLSEH